MESNNSPKNIVISGSLQSSDKWNGCDISYNSPNNFHLEGDRRCDEVVYRKKNLCEEDFQSDLSKRLERKKEKRRMKKERSADKISKSKNITQEYFDSCLKAKSQNRTVSDPYSIGATNNSTSSNRYKTHFRNAETENSTNPGKTVKIKSRRLDGRFASDKDLLPESFNLSDRRELNKQNKSNHCSNNLDNCFQDYKIFHRSRSFYSRKPFKGESEDTSPNLVNGVICKTKNYSRRLSSHQKAKLSNTELDSIKNVQENKEIIDAEDLTVALEELKITEQNNTESRYHSFEWNKNDPKLELGNSLKIPRESVQQPCSFTGMEFMKKWEIFQLLTSPNEEVNNPYFYNGVEFLGASKFPEDQAKRISGDVKKCCTFSGINLIEAWKKFQKVKMGNTEEVDHHRF
ncbi:hypothetical protein CDAR_271012 [Caerostris darwini]|uniref:Uncharacterized protein n=1 Tax=Caerostris darwini TaxID=1538125 RepID=A0AAV4TAC3_9ARAC|nr:hypothetical protein CDAR_271012 [Caerostris darwini]